MVYTKQVGEQLIKDSKKEGAVVLRYFNIGKGNLVLEMVETFDAVNHIKLNYKIVDRRPGDIEQIYADTQTANFILKWKAEKGIKEALADAWVWELSFLDNKLSA